MIKAILVIGLIAVIVLGGAFYYNSLNEVEEPECLEKGSLKEQLQDADSLYLKYKILKSGNKLGSYFDKNYC